MLRSLGLPRGGCRKPVTRRLETTFERADTTFCVPSPRASGASQRFFVAAEPARSLKTQQRETSRPLASVSLRGDMNPSSFPLEDDRAFELERIRLALSSV